ncbi:MAG: hypothetical protein MJ059_01985 [Lachnospiraceae bacterium]|nr:hypothetical protein [Lachnospiraceae bacterium]
MRTERFNNLYHGTDEESKKLILANGFTPSTSADLWCGPGGYFYDIKAKACWYGSNKCNDIYRQTMQKLKPAVIKAHVDNINAEHIFDLRDPKTLEEFESSVSAFLDNAVDKMAVNEYTHS